MENTVITEASDFEKLINELKCELETSAELTRKIKFFSGSLKPIDEDIREEGTRKEPAGIVEHIWDKIYDLRLVNNDLRNVANHLESVIGG